MNNLEEAISGDHELWTRAALTLGWSQWSLGVGDEELEEARAKAKEKREKETEKKRKEKKKKEKAFKKKEDAKAGYKTVRCSGIKSNGKRCGLTTSTKAKKWKCQHHMAFKEGMDRDKDGKKEYQCTGITKSGKRCKNKTENKSKKCWNHKSSSSKKGKSNTTSSGKKKWKGL